MDGQAYQPTQPGSPMGGAVPTGSVPPTPMGGTMPSPTPTPTQPGVPGGQPKKSNTGLIVGIVVGCIVLFFVLPIVFFVVFAMSVMNVVDNALESDEFQDAISGIYDELDRTTSDNYVAGTWNCAPGTGSTDDHDNFTTTLELNDDMTFRYGQYGDLRNNHYGGSYTFEDENKKNPSGDYSYYMVTFDTDEFVMDGEDQDTSEVNLSKMEMGITRTSEGKSAIMMFVSTYNMYYCYTY